MNLTPDGLHFLDTNAVVDMMGAGIVASPEAFLPFVAHGELLTGVYRVQTRRPGRCANADYHRKRAYHLPEAGDRIYLCAPRCALAANRAVIPTNDLWIAALALEWDLPLLTSDAHFTRVQELKLLPPR